MHRRDFIKKTCIAGVVSILSLTSSFASDTKNGMVDIKMVGDLDDDLFVIKASSKDWNILDCHQMHNQTGRFSLEGKHFQSHHSPGYIAFQKEYSLSNQEYLLIGLANEREERDDRKALLARTHYKSAPLHVNGAIAIPSMLPENKDLPDVPTWFEPHEEMAVYNYYRAWENALVNIAIVFPKEGEYTISFANTEGDIVAIDTFLITTKVKNIRYSETIHGVLDNHPMTEIDGGVFLVKGKKQPNDEDVKRLSPTHVLIIDKEGRITKIPLPYPFPYINRIFCVTVPR